MEVEGRPEVDPTAKRIGQLLTHDELIRARGTWQIEPVPVRLVRALAVHQLAAAGGALDAADPAVAAGLCGAIHDPRTQDAITALADEGHPVLRPSAPYAHPDFPNARTATPLILQLDADDRALAQREHFGPMAFVIRAPDRDAALAGATADARDHGAIASYTYTIDEAFLDRTLDAFAAAGASVGVNLVRHLPINFTAAFSDFHVTGLNPAGNASLTDAAFVAGRIVRAMWRRPVAA